MDVQGFILKITGVVYVNMICQLSDRRLAVKFFANKYFSRKEI